METSTSLKVPDIMGDPLSLEILKPVGLFVPIQAIEPLRPANPGTLSRVRSTMQHNRHRFEYMFMGAKQNYILVLRGFVLELEQI